MRGVAVATGLALVLGCGARDQSEAAPRSAPAPAAAPAEAAPEPVTAALAPPAIELLDPGRTPHAVVRVDPRLGEGALALALESSMAVDMGVTAVPPTQIPTLHLNLATRTRNGEAGTFVLELKASSVEALTGEGESAAAAAMMAPTVDALRRLEAELILGADGALLEATLRVPPVPGVSGPSHVERLRSAFAQMFVAFPPEPIGVGARWAVTNQFDLAGTQVVQRTQFVLRDASPERLTVDLEFTQRRAIGDSPGPAESPAPAMLVTVDELHTTGSGRMELDPRSLVPVSASSKSHGELLQTIDRDGQRQQVALTLDLRLRATGSSPAAP